MFEFWFYGIDGEFEYCIGAYDFPEYAFRHAMVREGNTLQWRFDGDGWHTDNDLTFESGHVGGYLIIRRQ